MKTNKATQIALAGTGAVLASSGADAYIGGVGVTSARDGEITIWWQGTDDTQSLAGCPPLEGSVSIRGTLENGGSYGPVYQEMDTLSCGRPAFASPTHAGELCEIENDGGAVTNIIWDGRFYNRDPDPDVQGSLGYDPADPVLEEAAFKPAEYGGGLEDYLDGDILLCNDGTFAGEDRFPWQGATIGGLQPGTYTVTYLDCRNSSNIDGDCARERVWETAHQAAVLLSVEIDVTDNWDGDNLPDDDNPGFEIPAAPPITPVPVMGWLGSLVLALITAVTAGLRLRRRARA